MRAPDLSGVAAFAWRMHDRLVPRREDPVDWQGCVSVWFIDGPQFHPLWHWWRIQAVHLRPIVGAPPARLHFQGATHEIAIMSVDPEGTPNVDATTGADLAVKLLSPFDLVHQVGGITDQQAAKIVEGMVGMMVRGHLSPDSDFRGAWETIITNTAQHMVLGGHPKAGA